MFSKLPQKLTSPFGILGDDAKLAFRTQASGIRRLADNRNIRETDAYWDQFTTLFDSPSDVFSLISSNDIRRALTDAPENVATLIHVLSTRLFNLVSDHTFPAQPSQGVSSIASNIIKTAGSTVGVNAVSSARNTTTEALNCLRVLQRVLPVLFENEFADLEKEILWTREQRSSSDGVERSGQDGRDEQPQFVIEDDEDDEGGGPTSRSRSPTAAPGADSTASVKTTTANELTPTLAERLISCSIDLLFCCGFTLPLKLKVDHYKINYVIWEKGVGSTLDPGPNNAQDQNKVEVLRFLLVLLSKEIYIAPGNLLSTPSDYTLTLAQETPRRHVLAILCSLLNTAMNSTKPLNTAGIGSVTAALPYNHLVFKGEDVKTTLVGESLQVLCALLDYQNGSARDVFAVPDDPSSASPTAKTNAFRYFLAKLHRQTDFLFIAEGILGIFEQQINAMNNFLPGSKKLIPHVMETIIFFWKMIELNKKFRTYLLNSEKAIDFVVYLLCFAMEAKDKPQHHGLCRVISYILQTLSAERAFDDKLTSPVKLQLPAKWATTGTLADFMISSVYAIVATTSGTLNSLYPALIIALSNSAPFFKHLSVTSSNKLVSLFTSFSNPTFLLSDEGHPRLIFFLLEVFNGVIHNHPDENPNLLYAILRSHKSFEDMGTFTLARGLREIRRVQKAKEEQAKRMAGKKLNKVATGGDGDDDDDEAPDQEKARLLTTASRDALGLSADVDLEARLPPDPPIPKQVTSTESHGEEENEQDPLAQPMMSPTAATADQSIELEQNANRRISEKARGKLPERPRSSSLDTNSSLERIAAAGVGRNGFIPTQDWVTSWQQGLPLDPVLLTISELLPKVQNLQASSSKTNSAPTIIDFLCSVSLGSVLPERPPPPSRRFLWSDSSLIWLSSLIWGEIYVKGMVPLGIWNATNVRLFHVKHTPSQTRQISDTVSQVMGGLGGLLTRDF